MPGLISIGRLIVSLIFIVYAQNLWASSAEKKSSHKDGPLRPSIVPDEENLQPNLAFDFSLNFLEAVNFSLQAEDYIDLSQKSRDFAEAKDYMIEANNQFLLSREKLKGYTYNSKTREIMKFILGGLNTLEDMGTQRYDRLLKEEGVLGLTEEEEASISMGWRDIVSSIQMVPNLYFIFEKNKNEIQFTLTKSQREQLIAKMDGLFSKRIKEIEQLHHFTGEGKLKRVQNYIQFWNSGGLGLNDSIVDVIFNLYYVYDSLTIETADELKEMCQKRGCSVFFEGAYYWKQ